MNNTKLLGLKNYPEFPILSLLHFQLQIHNYPFTINRLPVEPDVSDYWIARGAGLVAFQEDSIQYVRK